MRVQFKRFYNGYKTPIMARMFFFKVFQYVDILMYHMHLDTFISIKCGLQMNNFGNLNILGFLVA